MKSGDFKTTSAPPIWVSTAARLPTADDADQARRVWVIALDAKGRAYPGESSWRSVCLYGPDLYTHWAPAATKTWPPVVDRLVV